MIAAALSAIAAACTSSETSQTLPSIVRCAVTVTNSPETVPASGGSGTVTIAAARDCTWTASNAASWIAFTSATNGQGDGTVTYRVASNSDPVMRRGTIDVNTISIAVSQEAAPCRFTVTPSPTAVGGAGGDVAIQVQANAVCRWTAASEVPWIRVTAGASGQGDGSVAITVEANPGAQRSGRVIVAGTPVVVEQSDGRGQRPPAPGCSYSIQPGAQTIAAAGGTGTIDVTASASTCAWTAVSSAAWLTIAGGASATGSGRVTFNVAGNLGASRTASITVAGHSFMLTQAAAACSYSIDPSTASLAAGGGTTAVAVSAGPSCAWTAASNASWITVASGASGTGAGSVSLNVSGNTGPLRTGTVTIATRTFTVTQGAAPCSFTLSPAAVDVAASGGDATTNVTTTAGCAWTATSNNPDWITVTAGSSGTGSGTVRVTAAANAGAARTGTVTIGGQTLTVRQAAPCSFGITPTSQTISAVGGSGTVAVTAGASCGWTATSNNTDWLTITAGAAGTGSGSVTFSAAGNTGSVRVGTLTIAGQTFTLNQDAPCTFALDPQAMTLGAAGGTGSVTVTTGAACSWTAVSNNTDWLTVTGGSPAIGTAPFTFSAAPNSTGADRVGTITVGGVSFTLTQTAQ
jgi:hypothetical protein